MDHGRTKLLSAIFGIALMFSSTSQANPFGLSGHINRLFQALEYVVQADQLCEGGSHYAAKSRLRIASYRVRIVLADIQFRPGLERAVHALKVTNEKILDPGLSAREKVNFGLDCLAVALQSLVQRNAYYVGNLHTAKTFFRLAKSLTRSHVFAPVEQTLQLAKRYLRPVGCPLTTAAYRRATAAINVAIDKIQDNGLTPSEKAYFVNDCLNVAERHLNSVF